MRYLLGVLIFVVISLNFFLNKRLKVVRERQMNSERMVHFYKNLSESLKLNLNLSFEYQNFQLPNLLVRDVNGDDFMFKSLINKKSIVAHFSEFSCDQCIDSMVYLVNKSMFNNCIFIGEYRNINALETFFRETNPEYPIYNCLGQILPFDTLKIPYLFVVDSNLVLKSFFIPLKEDMSEIEKYLDIVSDEL